MADIPEAPDGWHYDLSAFTVGSDGTPWINGGGLIEWAPSLTSPAYLRAFGRLPGFSPTLIRLAAGETWEPTGFDQGEVYDLLALRASVLAVSANGLFRSDGGGLTWPPYPNPFYEYGGLARDLALDQDGHLYAAASDVLDGTLEVFRTSEPFDAEAPPSG